MRSDLAQLAVEVGADPRTLRRAVSDGLVHGHRPGPRKLHVPQAERRYLIRHWGLLSRIRRVLRTEPSVRLAVLHGSVARGTDDTESDIDLLVLTSTTDLVRLAMRLQRRLGRTVDLASIDAVDPVLLAEAVEHGRVLLDRDSRWQGIVAQLPQMKRKASRSFKRQLDATADALEAVGA